MPRLSKKTMFAIEAVLDVAFHVGEHPVRSGDITERQRIPKRYLEQVLQHLVRAGILNGKRGPRGGYRLGREQRRITLGEVVRVVRKLEAKAAKAKPNPRNKKLYDDGMKVRKSVLGADYVDNSMAGADDFMMSFQDITTEYAWGYVWTRPGLPRKTRSMLNLAMLAALNRA